MLLTAALATALTFTAPATDAGPPDRAFAVTVTGSGRPMVFVPGLLSSGEVWDEVRRHFESRYECHVLTLGGFAGERAVTGPFLTRVRDDLIAYIQDRKLDRPVLVGHSLGAAVAYWVASEAPRIVGAVVAVDGVPFLPALLDPDATVEKVRSQAEQMRALYASMTATQLAMQTRMALASMISDPRHIDRAVGWAERSDPDLTGRALFELMTTDLRPQMKKIEGPVLLVPAMKPFATRPDREAAVVAAYEGQLAEVERREITPARNALHFVMLDDPAFLIAAMDRFLAGESTSHGHNREGK